MPEVVGIQDDFSAYYHHDTWRCWYVKQCPVRYSGGELTLCWVVVCGCYRCSTFNRRQPSSDKGSTKPTVSCTAWGSLTTWLLLSTHWICDHPFEIWPYRCAQNIKSLRSCNLDTTHIIVLASIRHSFVRYQTALGFACENLCLIFI